MESITISKTGLEVLDICQHKITSSTLENVRTSLRPAEGEEKRLPTMLLYDEKGLKYFEEITYLKEYYLTNTQIEILERYANSLAARIEHGAMLVEFGSG